MNILIDDQELNFAKDDFPMLISGTDNTGTSFFSICLLANLLNSGLKVLFFSAYSAAKEAFKKHIVNEEKAIIIESGEESAFIYKIKNTTDLSDRIILIKNIETYSPKIFEAVKDLKLVIFSGDLDKCHFTDDLIKKDFATKIFFSQSDKYPQIGLDNLPRYRGKIFSNKYQGIINLDIL